VALPVAIDVEVEIGNECDSILIRYYSVKDSWPNLNT
jgi:hypothetical protein